MLEGLSGLGSALGGALGQAGDVLSAPRRALWSALGGPESGTELVHNLTGMDQGSVWTKALGLGAETLGDPLTYAGWGLGALGKLAGLGTKGAEAAAAAKAAELGGSAASGTEALLGARRGFGAVKDIKPLEDLYQFGNTGKEVIQGKGYAGTFAGGVKRPEIADAVDVMGSMGGKHFPAGYFPGNEATPGVIMQMAGADPVGRNLMRHETAHGLVDQARLGGGAGLPLPFRAVGAMANSGSPFVRGLGHIADETLAHSVEGHGLVDQLMRGGKYLLNPNPGYYDAVAKTSPLASHLWQYAPGAALAAPAAGIAGGLGYAAFQQ